MLGLISTGINAQKFGYVDTQELLGYMSDVKLAENKIQKFQNDLISESEEMAIKFEGNYNAYLAEAQKGILSQVQMQQRETELIAAQEELKKFEESIRTKVITKSNELYAPILDKIRNEIKNIGEEGGYTMIFDTSAGSLLHAAESDNLIQELRDRLASIKE